MQAGRNRLRKEGEKRRKGGLLLFTVKASLLSSIAARRCLSLEVPNKFIIAAFLFCTGLV